MAGKDFAKKIAVLGSLCGITSRYWDNFGRLHRTSQATYRDLLSAMGVPWEDPALLDREIARRQFGSLGGLAGTGAAPQARAGSGPGDGADLVPRA